MIFDEYIEEVNDTVKYGIYYSHRAVTDTFNRSILGTQDEDYVTIGLKIKALESIQKDINDEVRLLKELGKRKLNGI